LEIADATREIVGVVGNITQRRLAGVEPPEAVIYMLLDQRPVRGLHAILRSEADPYALVPSIREALKDLAPDQPMGAITTIEEHITRQLAGPEMIARILYGVGLLALALAAMGIYGVMTFAVSQQTGEIGLRMALGARPKQILARVAGQGVRLAGLGLLVGLPLAAVVAKLVSRVFEVADQDGIEAASGLSALPVAQVGVLLLAVGLFACYLPARRATQVDPVRALEAQ
jgi:ABC-type antimicrobial peptide transport system permease subunit